MRLVRAAAAIVLLVVAAITRPSSGGGEQSGSPLVRFIVQHPWVTLASLIFGLTLAGAIVVISGIVPIKASSGHWPITAWFLDFAKLRSVATHSLAIQAPNLDDEMLIVRGAGQYEIGCYSCHGGPGGGVSPVMAAMTPTPPVLADTISRYTSEELFSIIKHGIKFTGMPAWPVQERDDEVWAMVSFVRTMPGLDSAGYRGLAYGDSGSRDVTLNPPSAGDQPPAVVRGICWRCHGLDGRGRGAGAFPSLAGQRADYLLASLRAYKDHHRFSGIMHNVAAGLDDMTMHQVANYYSRLPPRPGDATDDASAVARGAAIAKAGVADRDIPICAECHGPSDTPKNRAYPRLAGQHLRFLELQLQLLKQRRRGGSPNVSLMHVFVDRLGPDHIRDVTRYYASTSTQ